MAIALASASSRVLSLEAPDSAAPSVSTTADCRQIDPRVDETWDRRVLDHPQHTFFHSAAWARVLCRTYGHRPFYLELRQSGQCLALLPLLEVNSRLTGRRAVCLPFSDFCGPLLFGESPPHMFEDHLAEIGRARKWRFVELRGGFPRNASLPSHPTFYGHQLQLAPGVDDLFSGFDSSVRRAIRKSERSPLAVQISDSPESVDAFLGLHARTRRRLGVPPQSRCFFEMIQKTVLEPGFGFVVQASLGSRAVAAAMFFHSGNGAVYKFGASDERFHEHRGNNLVMWEGIKEVKRRGAQHLHFGRTACDNHGLRRYKCSWSATEEPLFYARFDPVRRSWAGVKQDVGTSHEHFFRRMPLAVNRLAGTLLYPHLH
ncbi:hypothetical protein BH18VER1_BH18VER1_19730 [soil metagenome]